MQISNDNFDRQDFELNLLAVQLLLSVTISGLFRFLFQMVFNRATYGMYLYMLITIIELAYILIKNFKTKSAVVLLYMLIYFLFLLAFYFGFPQTRVYYIEYLNDLIFILFISVPGFFVFKNIRSFDSLFVAARPFLRGLAIVFPIIYFLGARNFFDYMSWGSRMLPIAILYALFNKHVNNILDRILFVLSIVFTAMGGRQSLVILVIGLLLIQISGAFTVRKVVEIFILIVLSIIAIAYYSELLKVLEAIIIALNISSRSLSALVSGTLLDSSNRIGIYTRSTEIIQRNGVKVSGLFADRLYLRQYRSNIAYCHNIFLEFLIDFGSVWGSFIILVFVYKVVKKFIQIKQEYKLIFILFFLICVARLFVSSSYLISYTLPLYLGLISNEYLLKENVRNKRFVLKLK